MSQVETALHPDNYLKLGRYIGLSTDTGPAMTAKYQALTKMNGNGKSAKLNMLVYGVASPEAWSSC